MFYPFVFCYFLVGVVYAATMFVSAPRSPEEVPPPFRRTYWIGIVVGLLIGILLWPLAIIAGMIPDREGR